MNAHASPDSFVPVLRVSVTDHALLRWLERVYGVDIDRMRRICEMETLTSLTAKANGYEGSPQSAQFVMENGHLITVLSAGFTYDANRYPTSNYVPRYIPRRQA